MAGWEISAWAENIESQVSQSVSSWNEQADAAITALKEKALSSLTHPTVQELAKAEYDELMEAINGHDEVLWGIDGPRKEFEWDIKALRRIDSKFNKVNVPGWDTQAGLDNMIAFIWELPWENQELLYDVFNTAKTRDLKKYFKANGFINSETYENFIQSDVGSWLHALEKWESRISETEVRNESTDEKTEAAELRVEESEVRAEESEVRAEEAEVRAEEAEARTEEAFLKLRSIAVELKKNSDIHPDLLNIFSIYLPDSWRNYEDIKEEEYNKVTQYFEELSKDPEAFVSTLDSLWGQESELYTQVKSVVLAGSPGLQAAFERYEQPDEALSISWIGRDLGLEVTEEMNSDYETDNLNENYDYSTNPPRRTLSVSGSDYEIDGTIPVADMYPATVEYTNAIQEIQPKLNSINSIMAYISSLSPNADIVNVKEVLQAAIPYTLRQSMGLDINRYNTIDDLQTGMLNILWLEKSRLEKKKKDAEKKYDADRQEMMVAYKKTIRSMQESKESTLRLLKTSGFGYIPKTFTDQIIAEINIVKNVDLWRWMTINTDINIAEGEFWYDGLWDSHKEQEALVRLVNLMVSWETDWENAFIPDPESFIMQNKIVNNTEFIHALNHGPKSIITNAGWLDMEQVRKNLGWNGWNPESNI